MPNAVPTAPKRMKFVGTKTRPSTRPARRWPTGAGRSGGQASVPCHQSRFRAFLLSGGRRAAKKGGAFLCVPGFARAFSRRVCGRCCQRAGFTSNRGIWAGRLAVRLDERIEGLRARIAALARARDAGLPERLNERAVSGPPIISSANVAAIGAGILHQGRDFAAWLGLGPKQFARRPTRTVLSKYRSAAIGYLRRPVRSGPPGSC